MRAPRQHRHGRAKHRGAALMIMIVILVAGAATVLVGALSTSALRSARQERTSAALVQARDALIGFSVKVLVSSSDIACAATSNCPRPGDLPCPDTDNDGDAESSCGSADGSTGQAARLGRLPWKTLGLPDLRDGSGERLWYAVSNRFKNNTRSTCNNSELVTGCLNSDTPGTITVSAASGGILHNGAGTGGAVAVIIAPGAALIRQGSSLMQDRSSAGINTASNYLDIATVGGVTEDNANFVDGSAANGFIHGPVLDSAGKTILNDHLLAVTADHIIPLLEKRVAAEVRNCLTEYAAIPQNRGPSPNDGYYPWATSRSISAGQAVYNDADRLEFGHVPDLPFAQTCSDTGGSSCGSTQSGGMKNGWGAACTLNNSNWWVNWKEQVFYSLAHSLRPHNMGHNHVCPGSTCLTVNPPSATNDKSFVIIVAGKKLGTQSRNSTSDKNTPSNYLEGTNLSGTSPFQQSPVSATFNDVTVFK
ncbi:MAG: hypothetical protein A2V79_04570 [Betaproteobacteria bacterium RBG_16_56_24]|nr:MAG: hypothetical protein A2V79_04570 [Betaproteobacteria bacterium RBG_16_56_24]